MGLIGKDGETRNGSGGVDQWFEQCKIMMAMGESISCGWSSAKTRVCLQSRRTSIHDLPAKKHLAAVSRVLCGNLSLPHSMPTSNQIIRFDDHVR